MAFDYDEHSNVLSNQLITKVTKSTIIFSQKTDRFQKIQNLSSFQALSKKRKTWQLEWHQHQFPVNYIEIFLKRLACVFKSGIEPFLSTERPVQKLQMALRVICTLNRIIMLVSCRLLKSKRTTTKNSLARQNCATVINSLNRWLQFLICKLMTPLPP